MAIPFEPIALQYKPFDALSSISKSLQLKQAQQEYQMGQMKLAELTRQLQEAAAQRQAAAMASGPQSASVTSPAMGISGAMSGQPDLTLPQRTYSASTPAGFDRSRYISSLAQVAPQLVNQAQNEFAMQDLARQKAQADMAEKNSTTAKNLSDAKKFDAETAAKHIDAIGAAAQSLLPLPDEQAAALYPTTLRILHAQGIDLTGAPQQWDRNAVQQIASMAVSAKDQLSQHLAAQKEAETVRHNKATEASAAEGHRITLRGQNLAHADATAPDVQPTPVDPNSQSLLAQTGLSLNAFRVLTGQSSQLPRDKETRNRASKEAEAFLRKNGIDNATFSSQYKANSDVLASNISRMANTKIMENELQGTIDNLKQVATDKDLGNLKFANVAKIWAGQEVNDSLAQQYAIHLSQLRNELTAYYGATQGRTGNNLTVQDKQEAEQVIKNGISTGSLNGLQKAIANSTEKMGTVMQRSVDAANRAVWTQFGVGQNYKSGKAASGGAPQSSGGGDPFAQFGGVKH